MIVFCLKTVKWTFYNGTINIFRKLMILYNYMNYISATRQTVITYNSLLK